jgi:hypothetical protein
LQFGIKAIRDATIKLRTRIAAGDRGFGSVPEVRVPCDDYAFNQMDEAGKEGARAFSSVRAFIERRCHLMKVFTSCADKFRGHSNPRGHLFHADICSACLLLSEWAHRNRHHEVEPMAVATASV